MWAGGLLSASINFLCRLETFCQHRSTLLAAGRPSVNFLYIRESFHKLTSTFRAARRSLNFRQISAWPGDLPLKSVKFPYDRETFGQFPSILHVAGRLSINFHQHSVWPNNRLSTFRAAGRSSIKFPNEWGCSVNICQLSVRPGNLSSISQGSYTWKPLLWVEGVDSQ